VGIAVQMPRCVSAYNRLAVPLSLAFRSLVVLSLVAGVSTVVDAQQIRYAVSGLNEPMLSNVRDSVEGFRLTGNTRASARQFDDLARGAEERAREAMKPYGYYQPEIVSELVQVGDDRWRLNMRIKRGPVVRVAKAEVTLLGDGAAHNAFLEWQEDWPLGRGRILNQTIWQQQKNTALEIAETQGFLLARFTENVIEIDLIRNEASLSLVLDTGPQAVFGEVEFLQDVVNPAVLSNMPRFDRGDPYSTELMEKLRLDLWATGYFTDIDVKEERQLDRSPPTVDVVASLETDTRNTYQGTIGFGTDTGLRAQAVYHRRLLTSFGHRLDLGIGYQEFDDELSVRGNYRIPRLATEREFWIADLTLRTENQDLEFKSDESDESFVKLANGNIDNLFLRLGKLRLRDRKLGFQQIQETIFAQFLRESYDYDPGADAPPEIRDLSNDPGLGHLFRDRVSTLALGIEWDWPAIRGSGFETEGHHERAWIFTSNGAWGSDRDFTQVYLSSRRSYLKGERFKFLLRGEIGYSDANVDDLVVNVAGEPLSLSITELPNQYRFKAGGSNSVRGYGFEDLNDNDVGSNNIITASAEVEMRILPKWSVAAFFDIGNAFNDSDEPSLKRGIGVGVRWYSLVGAIRIDVAQALDFEGKPLRIHFTMGSPLL
jgi:translocation and assembly module TamA